MTEAELSDKTKAGIEFLRRAGAHQVQFRYSDDEAPTIWFTVFIAGNGKWDVDAGKDIEEAILRLCERLADGGQCVHCGRPSGLEYSSLGTMPLNESICWYQYDPELKTFRRGCE